MHNVTYIENANLTIAGFTGVNGDKAF